MLCDDQAPAHPRRLGDDATGDGQWFPQIGAFILAYSAVNKGRNAKHEKLLE
jgi:hypothetical protein